MNKLTVTILILLFLNSCNSNNNGQKQRAAESPEAPTNQMTCFAFNNGEDSIMMSLERKGNQVHGNLSFNYYEKDSNRGTFLGNINGDTLWANYSFLSEGIVSNREVVFLRKEDDLIQGYGEVTEREGNLVFTNRNDIRFDNNFILSKVACKSSY